jgi:hypothetical protein
MPFYSRAAAAARRVLSHGRALELAHDAQRRAEQERDSLAERIRQSADQGWLETSSQGLFVMGHARSGTTVLQNALNASREIYLFGEAHLHSDKSGTEFVARYNQRHHAWGNHKTKSTFCSPFPQSVGDWRDFLTHLTRIYRYVGDKVVFSLNSTEGGPNTILDFYGRYFFTAHYIFTFRDPRAVLQSTRSLSRYFGDPLPDVIIEYIHFLTILQIYLHMVRNFPHVRCVFHENISAETFDELGDWLDEDLSMAYPYYDDARVVTHEVEDFGEVREKYFNAVAEIYDAFKLQALAGFELAQMSQNPRNTSPTHFTPMGRLTARIEDTITELKAMGVPRPD